VSRFNIRCVLLSWVIISVYTQINSFSYLVTGVSYIIDLEKRINLNDSTINFFHFFWTTFTYLPTLFLTLFLIFFINANLNFKAYQVVLVLIFSISCYVDLTDLLISNFTNPNPSKLKPQFNLLLTNTLNKYHPFILYISIISVLKLSNHYHLLRTTRHLFLYSNLSVQLSNKTTHFVVINLLALYLGGWWALQEGTWGGWWAWESSEVLGLLVTLYGLSNIHLFLSPSYLTHAFRRLSFFYLILILSYLLIQLSFEIVAHNFGEKSSTNFSLESSYLKYIFMTTISMYLWVNYFVMRQTHQNVFNPPLYFTFFVKKSQSPTYGLWLLFVFIMCFLVVSSFAPIWQHFLWNYFGIAKDDYTISLAIFVIQCALIVSFTLHNRIVVTWHLLLLLLLLTNSTSILSLLFVTIPRNSSLRTTHLILLFLYVVNIVSYDFYFVQVFQKLYFMDFTYSTDFLIESQRSYSCDYLFVNKSTPSYTNYQLSSSAWSFFYLANKCAIDAYLLQFHSTSFYSLFNVGGLCLRQIVYVEYNMLNNLVNTLFIFVILFCYWLNVSKISSHRLY